MAAEIAQIQRHCCVKMHFVGMVALAGLPQRCQRALRQRGAKIGRRQLALAVARQSGIEAPMARPGHRILAVCQLLLQSRHHHRTALCTPSGHTGSVERHPHRHPLPCWVYAAMGIGHPRVLQQAVLDLGERHALIGQFDDAVLPPQQLKAICICVYLYCISGLLPAVAPRRLHPQHAFGIGFVRQRGKETPRLRILPLGNHPGFGAAVNFLHRLRQAVGQHRRRGFGQGTAGTKYLHHLCGQVFRQPMGGQRGEQGGAGHPHARPHRRRGFQQAFRINALLAPQRPARTQRQHNAEGKAIQMLRCHAAHHHRARCGQGPCLLQGAGFGLQLRQGFGHHLCLAAGAGGFQVYRCIQAQRRFIAVKAA